MAKQSYWDDYEVGAEIPAIEKVATTRMLVQWAGASGDFNPLHYDETFANGQGPGIIVHGALKNAWLGHLLMDFIGLEGTLKKYGCQYRGQDRPRRMKTTIDPLDGETWKCRGVVTKKHVQAGEHILEVDVWVENGAGEKTTPGYGVVALPSRG